MAVASSISPLPVAPLTDTLLRVLSNADLDWMIAQGDRQRLSAGDSLFYPQVAPDRLALVIEGRLAASVAPLGREAEAAIWEGNAARSAMDELGPGELVGVSPLLEAVQTTAVKALVPTQVLVLPMAPLQAKLADDVAFAAHLYRAIALQLADRLRRLLADPDRLRGNGGGAGVGSDVLTVFSHLRDSDIDWLTSFGQTETIPGDRVLLRAGRPVESLYILLDGQMLLSAPSTAFNPLALCFLPPAGGGAAYPEENRPIPLATLTQGTMPGMMAFLDFRPLPVTVRSLGECLVFAIPRQALATKLQVDDSFASRFYRVLAMQILEQLQTFSRRLGGLALATDPSDPEELAMDDLQQLSEGAKKFGWMLSQLGVSHDG